MIINDTSAEGEPRRLVVILSSPRVAPGLLSAQAWQALSRADMVVSRYPDHPQLPYLRGAFAESHLHTLSGGESTLPDSAASDQEWAHRLIALAAQHHLVYLAETEGEKGVGRELARCLHAATTTSVELEIISAAWDLPGSHMVDLVELMDLLRSPGGCPWDAQQTHASLVTYLIEETYELVEALETGDRDALKEELGDLLLQIVFHSRIAEEDPDNSWSLDEVVDEIVGKLRSRHPHVFDPAGETGAMLRSAVAESADDQRLESMETAWQHLKNVEKQRRSVLDGVPLAQPGLSLAAKVIARAQRGGVPIAQAWPSWISPPAEPAGDVATGEQIVGDAFFALVSLARQWGVDPEAALRGRVRELIKHIHQEERDQENHESQNYPV